MDTAESEDFVVCCSDEEIGRFKDSNATWEPSPDDIVSMYELLDSKGILELEWQCPGRRSPSVNSAKSDLLDKGSASDEDNSKQCEPNEFDFDDEFSTEHPSPKISPRKRINNVSSAQKRVARLDKVMFDIQRHRKLDKMEEKQSKSPYSGTSPTLKSADSSNEPPS